LVVEPEGRRQKYPSTMVDISQEGVRLKTTVGLDSGQFVEVIPHEGPRYAMRCRVVWVEKQGPDQEREIGLEFVKPTRWPV
jgi:hypothetical protein